MDSDTPNLILHLKQISKPISSDLLANLLYLLDVIHPQGIAARLVLRVSKTGHISPHLASVIGCPLIHGLITNSLLL